MNNSLIFIPDISGFTEFVQSTEVGHSQHVISELLELLIDADILDLELAEVEGDALFFYSENDIPSLEKILSQVETMFTAFYSHLKLLEKNRICPCNACSTAPNLQLKIIIHCGELQFISVQNKRKPFGSQVIEAHRLMKNNVKSNNYVLMTQQLANLIELRDNYKSRLYDFQGGKDIYNGKNLRYLFSIIQKDNLKLSPFSQAKKIKFEKPPSLSFEKIFPISSVELLEYITNYGYRHEWVVGVDKFEYNEDEVTRLGTEHQCVINGKYLDFVTITKAGKPGQLVYGELTTTPPQIDALYQFYIITPINNQSCNLQVEIYWKVKSPIKKLMMTLFVKSIIRKNTNKAMQDLLGFVESKPTNELL